MPSPAAGASQTWPIYIPAADAGAWFLERGALARQVRPTGVGDMTLQEKQELYLTRTADPHSMTPRRDPG